MPKISVIVPVYNAEEYLECCIESILSQTFHDFEIILVNDGSCDESGIICEAYRGKDERIRVIHQNNAGQGAARNRGIKAAKGNWISFVDADDLIHPQMLEHLYSAVQTSGASLSMCDALEENSIPNEFGGYRDNRYKCYDVSEEYLLELYKNRKYRIWTAWAKLIAREILIAHPFPEGRIYEDNAIVCRWLYAANKVTDSCEKLYFYRINPAGTTKSEFSIRKLDSLWAKKEQAVFFGKIGYDEVKKTACRNYIMSCGYMYGEVKQTRNSFAMLKLRFDLTRFCIVNYPCCKITNKDLHVLLSYLHPHMTEIYWYILVLMDKYKKHGIWNTIIKIVKRITDRVFTER